MWSRDLVVDPRKRVWVNCARQNNTSRISSAMDLQFASVADTGTVAPIEAHVCDVVLDDVVQSQGAW